MSKHKLFEKKVKNLILNINSSLESYFTNLKLIKKNFKKGEFIKNNRVFFGSAAVVILTLGYFLIPTVYDKNLIKAKIKNHIQKKYNIEIRFNEKIRYGLLPKPHFVTKNLSILRNEKVIGLVNNFDVFIGINSFFSFDKIEIKDFKLNEADFAITKDDLVFFQNLLKTEPNDNKIVFKRSNIFFKSYDGETLFLNKIKKGQFYYDSINLENVFNSKNEIFNIPYKLIIKNNKYNQKLFSNFNSKKIRLNIDNEINYGDKDLNGLLEVLFVNKGTELEYNISEGSLSFLSKSSKKSYKGFLDFKPFYFSVDFDYDGLSSKNLYNDGSIFFDLIKSEIFNNENLNAKINLDVKDITNIAELNNLKLIIGIEGGQINLSNSNLMWKDDLKITLEDSFFNYDEDGINLIGRLILDFKDLQNFYKSFQIKKNSRKEVKKVEIDFVYNFDQKTINFDNVKIDKKSNDKIEEYIDDYNLTKQKILNKITLKNFINNFFNNYAG